MSELYARIMANDVQKEIIKNLKEGEKTTSQLTEAINKLTPTGIPPLTVYLQAWFLEQKGLISSTGEGIERTYRLTDKWKELEAQAQKS
ncbi:MAG: hypothetical protein DRJ98_02190 [Thermoprotei archaeon]|nr:MAG: hypothetical protein DRJ98_02165 [Thermoprotei archaeon]RLF11921.1 MAG: hypothetical protein DRJ98_02190 [Thermoprotei archaeon]RLF14640.1 MAG: hypothetical protein DRN06_06835 [Thermoprotei archaeon]